VHGFLQKSEKKNLDKTLLTIIFYHNYTILY